MQNVGYWFAVDFEVRRKLQKRDKHEGALAYARMRNGKSFLADMVIPEDQNIDIDGARSPALIAHPFQPAFGVKASIKQLTGRKRRLDFSDRIEKIRLVGDTPRWRTIKRGNLDDIDTRERIKGTQGRRHRRLRVAEVTTKPQISHCPIAARQH